MTNKDFLNIVKPYTMTSVERINELFNSLEYIRINKIDGDFAEVGVYKGTSSSVLIHYAKKSNRTVYLFDTLIVKFNKKKSLTFLSIDKDTSIDNSFPSTDYHPPK